MKRYVLNNPSIPEEYLEDVKSLKKYIEDELGIRISLADTYSFWNQVSDYFDAVWLNITFHYEFDTREDSMLGFLEMFGKIEDYPF